MSKGTKRNKSDVALVSTGLKGGGGGSSHSEYSCPVSFRVEVKEDFRKMVGMRVHALAHDGGVRILCDQQEIAHLSGKKGERIAQCIADNGYKYKGTLVRDKEKLYAELQVA